MKAGDLCFTTDGDKLVQIREILETGQVLVYVVMEKTFLLVPLSNLYNRVEPGEEKQFVEDVLLVSIDGKDASPGKRMRVDDGRQIFSVRLKDGTIIQAPDDRIVVDASKMITVDILLHMLQQGFFRSQELKTLGSMARINMAYNHVVNNDRIWKFMLWNDYCATYMHYISAETRELHDIVKVGLDAYTQEPYKHNRRYYRRFYEFLKKLEKSRGWDRDWTPRLKKIVGVAGMTGITKYVKEVFQSGTSVYVMLGKSLRAVECNVIIQMRNSDNVFEMLTEATAPIAMPGVVIHRSTEQNIALKTYDQDGHVRYTTTDEQMVIYYFSESLQNSIIIWEGELHLFLTNMTKSTIALSFLRLNGTIFTSFIFSRKDGRLLKKLNDTWILRTQNLEVFLAVNLNDAYLQPKFTYDSPLEWDPVMYYDRYEGVLYNGQLYILNKSLPYQDTYSFSLNDWEPVKYDLKAISELGKYAVSGGWRVPFHTFSTSHIGISDPQLNLQQWLNLTTFHHDFNNHQSDIIDNSTLSEIYDAVRIAQSPISYFNHNHYAIRDSFYYKNGRANIKSALPVEHPIFNSKGVLYGISTENTLKMEKFSLDPAKTTKDTNLVSCSICSQQSTTQCSKCQQPICGDVCFQSHYPC